MKKIKAVSANLIFLITFLFYFTPMDIQGFLDQVIFSLWGKWEVMARHLIGFALMVLLLIVLERVTLKKLLPRLLEGKDLDRALKRKIYRLTNYVFLFGGFTAGIKILNADFNLYDQENVNFYTSYITGSILIWQLARLVDTLLSKILIPFLVRKNQQDAEPTTLTAQMPVRDRNLQYIVYALAALLFVSVFGLNQTLGTIGLNEDQQVTIRVSNIIWAILIFLIARFLYWMIVNIFLDSLYRNKKMNIGSQYAVNQLLKYVIFTIAVLFILDTIGVKLTVIWGGAAALLIGAGFGLQQTFNDFFSGILLLFERTVEVGDVVQLADGLIGTVMKIGMRTSFVQTFDNRTVIVPNSQLVVNDVINFSHNDEKARFVVSVGVAYGSDTELVKKLLFEAAKGHEKIIKFPVPFVRFVDFGDSSLDFELHFWSRELVRIDDVRSDLRFKIDQLFREHNIVIPFPQRDVWMKKEEE
jgi:small-conductance mechanosensitive channel